MSQALAKYHARNPRYVLRPEDDTLLRLSGPSQASWEENTLLENLSLTGLAFTAPSDLSPIPGEVIKIQFTVPETGPMACHALVVRVDKKSSSQNLIAVQFLKLELPQRLLLVQGLAAKLRNQKDPELEFGAKTFWDYVRQEKKWISLATGAFLLWSLGLAVATLLN
jgi:PilZ domain